MNIALAVALYLIPLTENWTGKDGDGGRSFGPYQISQGCIDDVNSWTHIGYTKEDCYNPVMARRIVLLYLRHYGEKLSDSPTVEDYCRIHNGGPDGWSEGCTTAYWKKCQDHLQVVIKSGKHEFYRET